MNRFLCLCVLALLPLCAAADVAKGKALFQEKCASCHGPEGAGDGPVAAVLPPDSVKPRNFQKEAFKVATDEAKFKDLVTKGGPAFGLNPLMAGQPGMSDQDYKDLYEFVTSLKK